MVLDRICRVCIGRAISQSVNPLTIAGPSRYRITSSQTQSQSRNLRHASSSVSSTPRTPLKVAIIGSGPSAFYSASRLLQLLPPDSDLGRCLEVHMYERLPTPYGLVRYGVAPDHPEVKNCQHKFDELSSDGRFRYFGNTLISPQASSSTSQTTPYDSISSYTYPHALHLPLSSILPYYTTLLLSYGASLSNPLDIPGRDLGGVYQALALVGWYNGHPAFADLQIDLEKVKNVSVIGQGNVALDVARILLKDPKELDDTDLPTPVLDVLHSSGVENVSVVGRRGPGQVAFTTKELREMTNLSGVAFDGVQGELMARAKSEAEKDRVRKRLLALMDKPSHIQEGQGQGRGKRFELDFLKSPKRFIPSPTHSSRVGGVEYDLNTLLPSPSPSPPPTQAGTGTEATPIPMIQSTGAKAVPTGETVTRDTDMIVESVGYRSEGLESDLVPFDVGKGRVRNIGGRVTKEDGSIVPGIYAAGWVARGPVGVIASTMTDAFGLAETIIADHVASSPTLNPASATPESGIPEVIARGLREGNVVDIDAWKRIDQAEVDRARKGKEREKFRTVQEMLAVLG